MSQFNINDFVNTILSGPPYRDRAEMDSVSSAMIGARLSGATSITAYREAVHIGGKVEFSTTINCEYHGNKLTAKADSTIKAVLWLESEVRRINQEELQ